MNSISMKRCFLLMFLAVFLIFSGGILLAGEPVLLGEIDISASGEGSRMLLGDLTGDGRLEIVMMQPDKMSDDRYIGHEVNALTVYDLDGDMLWQIGDPAKGAGAGSDIPAQIYDIDQDGKNEILAAMNGKLRVLNGLTGEEEYSFEYPAPDAHDIIIITNFSGNKKPQDIVLKDRYENLWAMDRFGSVIFSFKGNIGHYPWPYDLDGDGRDELIAGYHVLDHTGKELWRVNQGGHADCVWVGDITGDGHPEVALGGDDLVVYDRNGNLLWRNNKPVEPQNIALGHFVPDAPGLQMAGQDRVDRSDPGSEAIFFVGSDGELINYKERTGWYSILYATSNWAGEGKDYIMIWRSAHHLPGLFARNLEPVVTFPINDGYMMSADLIGNKKNEIIIFTRDKAYIYANEEIDLSKVIPGTSAPRPQIKRLYNFTRYWGGQYPFDSVDY